jgi:inosine/uridine nucleosidase
MLDGGNDLTSPERAARRPTIVDCDPGHDDAIALLLAAANPALDLRAITTVAGNGELDKVTLNARRICTLAGIRDVPIAAGADAPLARGLETAADVHGASALDGPDLPEPDVPLDPRPAHDLIADVASETDEPLTLVAIGPLTNVAVALDRHPDLAPRLREIIVMGGSTGRGNRAPYAEFNIWADPEAADRVFRSGVPVTMVGLNLTHQALATPPVVDRLRALDSDVARVVVGWITFFGSTYEDLWGFAGPPIHDACAVALAIDPTLMRCVESFVAIETEGRWTRGATVVDLHDRLHETPNASVALDLDAERFWDLVIDAVRSLGERAATARA